MMRACVALAIALMLSGASLDAQTQSSGWPGQETADVKNVDAKLVKSPVVATPATAVAPVKPAAAPKATPAKEGTPKPASKPAKPATLVARTAVVSTPVSEPAVAAAPTATAEASPAAATEKPLAKAVMWPDEPVPAVEETSDAKAVEPAPATPEPVAADSTSSEVASLLQQQADLLKKLAAEIESQRKAIKTQDEKIKSMEQNAAPTSSAPAVKAPAPPPPPPITVETGGVKLKVSGLFQAWYTGSSNGVVDTFRLRRAELKFAGDISPRIKWVVMVDPAKALSLSTTTGSMNGQPVVTGTSVSQSGRMMQDAFLSLNWKPALSIEVGQQRVPLGIEGNMSSSKLDVVERALFMSDKARGAGYADIRDLGLMVRGKAAGGVFEYSGGVFNGLGEQFNDVDRNEGKTMVGRFVAKPKFIKGLQLGVSMARDRFELFNETARERQGVDVAYTRGSLGFRTEFFGGRDAAVTRQGGYAQLTARATKTLTFVARFDMWDPDTRSEATAATVTERDWVGGFTYVLHPSGVWLQANYIRKTFDGLSPSRNVFMTNLQTSW